MINPKDTAYQNNGGNSERARECRPGDKILAAVGFERYSASTGSRCLSVRFVCVRDDARLGDERGEVIENFVIEDRSLWRFVRFVEAIGHHEPFDVDDDEAIQSILTIGYVRATLKEETYNGKTRARVDRWAPANLADEQTDPEWADWIATAEEGHARYMEWRAKNPRGSGGSGRSGGGSYGGGNAGGNAGGGRGKPTDDIPF